MMWAPGSVCSFQHIASPIPQPGKDYFDYEDCDCNYRDDIVFIHIIHFLAIIRSY